MIDVYHANAVPTGHDRLQAHKLAAIFQQRFSADSRNIVIGHAWANALNRRL